jgi:hypothetical protein
MGPFKKERTRMKRAVALVGAMIATLAVAGGAMLFPSVRNVARAAGDTGQTSGATVVDWNKELVRVVNTAGAQPATVHATRSFAILHVAIYDSVVSTTHDGRPYLFALKPRAGARPDAAAAQAGHDVLAGLFPSQAAAFDGLLATELGAIPDGAGKQLGIAAGRLSAQLTLAARSADGSTAAGTPPPPASAPGDWRPSPPANAAAVFTQWPAVTPWVLSSAQQFRPAPAPAVSSAAYAKDVNEVKDLGRDTSTTRTPDQTVAARFWPGPIWVQWNEIAEASVAAHRSDLNDTARLFALLNVSFADTVIAFYDAKYHALRWRPISAIRATDTGNPAVTSDPTWTPLIATGADPAYPGAHSAVSAAGAEVLESFFGKHDAIQVRSDSLKDVVRSFDSYDAAATEAGLSRIYGGVHTRADHDAGVKLGRDVANLVLEESTTSSFGFPAR